MTNFSIGLSALRSSQFALQVVSNNVSNANTEGYHRRRVSMKPNPPNWIGGFRIGNGVTVAGITRVRDQVTEASLTNVISESAHVEQSLTIERKIESALLTGDNAVGRQLDRFFAEFTALSASPNEPAQRTAVLESGKQVAASLRDASKQLGDLKRNVKLQIENEIDSLNDDMAELSALSAQIFRFQSQGLEANNELDQRDAVLNRIAATIGISRNEQPGGALNLTIGHHSIQQGNRVNSVRIEENNGQIEIYLDDSDRPLIPETGKLAALLESYNSGITSYEDKLDNIATELIGQFNTVHATGVGTAGSFQNLLGSTRTSDGSLPLDESFPDANLTAGELTLSLTDASGNRSTHVLTIDPATDSLDDLATMLTAIPGVTANLRSETNQLQITTVPGLKFDFAGGIETDPDLTLVTGSSVAAMSGVYTGEGNEDITVRVEGTGNVGSAASLYANVYSASGALLSRINLGEGYEAGSDIELQNGVRMTFSTGTLNDGDEFTTRLTGDPDETGTLATLGVNAFFRGNNAATIAIDQELLTDPDRVATGRSGEASDTSNLVNFIGIDSLEGMPGERTIGQYTNEVGTEIGFAISSNQTLSSSLTSFKLKLEQERDAKSGVDLNEELVYLQEYQKSYEAAVRVLQVTDDILNELFRIIG